MVQERCVMSAVWDDIRTKDGRTRDEMMVREAGQCGLGGGH